MTISEMHVWFRQYAQQMGMQNVRAILPEQIDLLINTSITDILNQLIQTNIGLTNDRIVTDNSKLGQINAFRTLYNVALIDLSPAEPVNTETRTFVLDVQDRLVGRMTTDFERVSSDTQIPDYLFLVDFSINYKKAAEGDGYNGKNDITTTTDAVTGLTTTTSNYHQPAFDTDAIKTNFFPVRMIDDIYLADTLNDFVLRNRLRSPIIVTYNNGTFDLYIDKFKGVTNSSGNTYYVLEHNLIPYQLRMSYIAKPAVVKYASDMGGTDVDCNLPESMHIDILKHAVDLWTTAVQGSLYGAQQNQQAQAREMSRNQTRPQNEGYQN